VGITIIGAAVLNIFEHVGEHYPTEVQWLLTVALVIVLLSIAALVHTIQSSNEHKRMHRVGSKTMVVSAILISVLGFFELGPILMLIFQVILIFVPILAGFIA
jgi:hypothetical protein